MKDPSSDGVDRHSLPLPSPVLFPGLFLHPMELQSLSSVIPDGRNMCLRFNFSQSAPWLQKAVLVKRRRDIQQGASEKL